MDVSWNCTICMMYAAPCHISTWRVFIVIIFMWFIIPGLTHWPLGDMPQTLKISFSDVIWAVNKKKNHFQWKCIVMDAKDLESALVQVMAWCHQARSHYLSQCWPRSMWPYGITRPQWVKKHVCDMHNVLDITKMEDTVIYRFSVVKDFILSCKCLI